MTPPKNLIRLFGGLLCCGSVFSGICIGNRRSAQKTGGSVTGRLRCFGSVFLELFFGKLFHKHILMALPHSFALHTVNGASQVHTVRAGLLVVHYTKPPVVIVKRTPTIVS